MSARLSLLVVLAACTIHVAPDVSGKSVAEATEAFTKAGFTRTPDLDQNANCKHDTVCRQDPAPGAKVPRSRMISFTVGP